MGFILSVNVQRSLFNVVQEVLHNCEQLFFPLLVNIDQVAQNPEKIVTHKDVRFVFLEKLFSRLTEVDVGAEKCPRLGLESGDIRVLCFPQPGVRLVDHIQDHLGYHEVDALALDKFVLLQTLLADLLQDFRDGARSKSFERLSYKQPNIIMESGVQLQEPQAKILKHETVFEIYFYGRG